MVDWLTNLRSRLKRGSAADESEKSANDEALDGEHVIPATNGPSVFLSYAPSDRDRVDTLRQRLRRDGVKVWVDKEQLSPGQDWRSEISDAIRSADCFLVCLSREAVNSQGYFQLETRLALEVAEERTAGAFLIPVRLEECEVPENLARYHWVDLFQPDGYSRLRGAIESGSPRLRRRVELEQREILREILIKEFSVEQIRQIAFELPQGRRVYASLDWTTSKPVIVGQLLQYLERISAISTLIDLLRNTRPGLISRYSLLGFDLASQAAIPKVGAEPLENPYIVGNPIQPSNSRVFLGRFDIANAIMSELKKPHQRPSILLYGRRRMGKTSALLNIRQLARDPGFMHVYISAQSARYHTNRDFCFYLVQAIKDKINEDGGDSGFLEKLGFLDRKSFDSNSTIALSECFAAFHTYLESRSLYCLLAIDEYEELDSHLSTESAEDETKHLTRQLLLELRDILQQRPRIMFLFAGTHYLRDLTVVDWSSIFINVRTLHVSFLDRRDSRLLLTQPVPGLSFESEGLIDRILDMTGCQPLLLQAVASEIVTSLNLVGNKVVTNTIIERAITAVLNKQNTYFNYIWENECDSVGKKKIVQRLARERALRTTKLRGPEEDVKDLVRKEVLSNHNGVVSLTMPLLGLWIETNESIL
jgi:TIR domain/AAA domain